MSSFQGTKINPTSFNRSQVIFYVILVPLTLFMVLPILYIVNQAFKPLDELFLFPPRFFAQNPTFDNFTTLFRISTSTGVPLSRYLFNTLLITLVMMILIIWISVTTGYAFSKKNFKGKKTLFSINQTALMFVRTAVVIPTYFVIVKIGLNNNPLVHILPYIAVPVNIFLMKQFIDQVPDPIIEAARIDGAGDFYIIFKIIMPLTKNAIATVAILTFQSTWSAVEASTLYIQDETMKSFAFYLNALALQNTGSAVAGTGMAAAAGLILFIPNLIIFIIMQSRVMNTMAHAGIK
ncbi:carbohydrate ABC transporter permease [Paracholeplasma manati]|jgi:multiple sugar transport system permease protein|uniref:Carbohydrate ABC transporter permease n=1 Tax=Paracholeplasma manati TaxID=591373 RepID=A0ABT2Y3M1_9MOLU|nr:carbohydrate ABC transporter permease [Paracholeplasma manati]MCV2231336.1 carbohydrate ABC transporter permease [Paracholeplasma manati]MDG0888416.1 carbohydrate ABC transporter permease [Paracholeplasma manati]MDX9807803.1 carbohydrate ABC transporter permease [Acholeplasma sp.]